MRSANQSNTMLAVDNYPDIFVEAALPKLELLEIHRSKISLHRAKTDYSYPTIRLPYSFSKLAGLSAHIYQTVHDGALAFLVVVSRGTATEKSAKKSENSSTNAKSPVLTWRRSPVRIRPSPSFFLQSATLEPSIEGFSDKIIMAKTHSATVKVIKDGRITIPQEIREVESIKEGDFIKITVEKIERVKR